MATFTYRFAASGRCPVDDTCNTYQFEIASEEPIMGELIAEAVNSAFSRPVTQESATQQIRSRVHGSVRSVGIHMIRVGNSLTRMEIEVFEQ